MADPLYLISGATGTTGRAAVTALRHAGKRVRAVVHKEDARAEALREQGAETIVGELLDLDQMRAAMEGVRGAYFVYPFKPGLIGAAAFFAQAAIEAGVESIVNMSQKPARRETKSEASRDHWITEQVFDWSDVPTTHIRPTFFAEWLLYPMDGWNVKAGVIEFPFADGRHAPIAGEDQGRVIAAVLQDPKSHAGKVYPLYGPVELNHYEIAEKLTKTLGRPFVYRPLTIPAFRARMENSGQLPRFVQHIVSVAQDYQEGIFAGTNNVVEDLTGRRPLTVEQFADTNRARFAK
ncbi:NAD(P)H dehydrogenase (quinone) [Bradyrhizobium sp. JR7.2]|uniref:NmrA family NAD(P)-binding protein n=1 Tax=Bradyrhizobium barranii TaxID=2992140 RepID=A0ABY3QZS6_9BRAD|nr:MULTISPECIES: NmrA family NAD(P)-binding protein [Bradyrhizobium]UFW90601.1 NmrA family NAD(P)-binding protein [Bradyrhizobium japonicum]WFT99160.1 NmrA family NAD(P)-binding protein [Bradyrhizobium barranii]